MKEKKIKYSDIKSRKLLETLEAFKDVGVKITSNTIITIKKIKSTGVREFRFETPEKNIGGLYSF